VAVAELVKSPEQPREKKIVRKLSLKEHFNSPTNSVETAPQVSTIQEEMNRWFRRHDETNPAASVEVRHLLQALIDGNLNFTEYVGILAALGQTEVPCYHLLEVSPFILRSNPT
jgi:hypothetical protein